MISSTISSRLDFTGSVMIDIRVRPGAAPDVVVVHGRMQGVKLQIRIAEPVAQFGDLRAVAIVQMLPRAENLHGGDARVLDLVQPDVVSR